MTPADDTHAQHETDAQSWDKRYADADQIWSGAPNGCLVTEVADLRPGRALDVGCGEGADAVWLAARGWDVVGLDVSRVALDRAARHALDAGVSVQWIAAGLLEAALEPGTFDLVSAQYAALLRSAERDAERALLAAVAPGGVLLVVHHPTIDHTQAHAHGFDPDDFVMPADIAGVLDEHWQIEVQDVRPRNLTSGAGAGHTEDIVLRARRLV